MLQHRDDRFDAGTKGRWRDYLAKTLKEPAPTQEAKQAEPAAADGFYERGGNWKVRTSWPVARSQSLSVLSELPDSTRVPSGENATDQT
jgi:hypothetical protein